MCAAPVSKVQRSLERNVLERVDGVQAGAVVGARAGAEAADGSVRARCGSCAGDAHEGGMAVQMEGVDAGAAIDLQ